MNTQSGTKVIDFEKAKKINRCDNTKFYWANSPSRNKVFFLITREAYLIIKNRKGYKFYSAYTIDDMKKEREKKPFPFSLSTIQKMRQHAVKHNMNSRELAEKFDKFGVGDIVSDEIITGIRYKRTSRKIHADLKELWEQTT